MTCLPFAPHTAAHRLSSLSGFGNLLHTICVLHSIRWHLLSATQIRKGYGSLHAGSLTPLRFPAQPWLHRIRPLGQSDNRYKRVSPKQRHKSQHAPQHIFRCHTFAYNPCHWPLQQPLRPPTSAHCHRYHPRYTLAMLGQKLHLLLFVKAPHLLTAHAHIVI